jgi:hypothetical protein
MKPEYLPLAEDNTDSHRTQIGPARRAKDQPEIVDDPKKERNPEVTKAVGDFLAAAELAK